MAGKERLTLRYWARTETGITWFMNGVEFLNWTKGRETFEGGCRPMAIEEWNSFAKTNTVLRTAEKAVATS